MSRPPQSDRPFESTTILLSTHDIDDLSSDLGEEEACSLLNAFCIAWHPALIGLTEKLPRWEYADPTAHTSGRQVYIVPKSVDDWLGHDWSDRVRFDGHLSLTNLIERSDYLDGLRELSFMPLHEATGETTGETTEGSPQADAASDEIRVMSAEFDPDVVTDFLVFGTMWFQTLRLSRRMHHFVDPDESRLLQAAHEAAAAACEGRTEVARSALRRMFETVQECRDQFHPVESYLLDFCLLSDASTPAELETLLKDDSINLMATARQLEQVAPAGSPGQSLLSKAVNDDRIELFSGDAFELPTPLVHPATALADMRNGHQIIERTAGALPRFWARRRFGFSAAIPAILNHFGYDAALHVCFDDGIYPDEEHARLIWEGHDGSSLTIMSRIPIAIDSSSSFLRLAERVAESMNHDIVTALPLARLPELKTPWLNDLRRAEKYAPILGRIRTASEFLQASNDYGRTERFSAAEYLSPFLIQRAVLKNAHPVTGLPARYHESLMLESLAWMFGVLVTLPPHLTGISPADCIEQLSELEQLLVEQIDRLEGQDVSEQPADDFPAEFVARQVTSATAAALQIGGALLSTPSAEPGYLVLNPLPFRRSILVNTDPGLADGASESTAIVDVPGGGYVWVPQSEFVAPGQTLPGKRGRTPPLAEELTLRNEFFEVTISDRTGGIGGLRKHGSRENRFSQQNGIRFDAPRFLRSPKTESHAADDDVSSETVDADEKTSYTISHMVSSRVLSAGPHVGTIETEIEILSPDEHQVLGRLVQRTSVRRGSPTIDISIRVKAIEAPDGNPWMSYFCSRFAWNDPTATVTRGIFQQVQGLKGERFESLDFVEIAEGEQRLTIIPHNTPFHRRTDDRMLDSLLIVDNEPCREFRFTIAVDQQFPAQASLDALVPPITVPTTNTKPTGSTTGALLNLSSRNVQIVSIRVALLADQSSHHLAGDEVIPSSAASDSPIAALRIVLIETEGRTADCKLRFIRPLKWARQISAHGVSRGNLNCDGNSVSVPLRGFEWCEVEVTF